MAETSRDAGRGRAGPSDEDLRNAVPRDRGVGELRVGAFVIVGFISFIVVLFLLTDPASLRGRYMVVTTMQDAGGVRRGDPIQMRGVNIGRVHDFEMTPDGTVDITMEIEGDWRIPEGSVVSLGASGLFGGRTMEVVPGPGGSTVEEWDTIPGRGEGATLFETAGDLGSKAEDVLTHLNDLLAGPTMGSVEASAAELQVLLGELNRIAEVQRDQLGDLTASLNRSARGLEDAAGAGPDVASAVARADSALLTLNRTTTTLDRAMRSLDTILTRLEAGEGTLGRLTTDDSLYVNLNRAAESIALLATDLRENPKRYLTVEIF
ncbi:MAG: MlaD family protein [Gemmatimonadota bacterium]|jgi:phospholipid/cholesterol/gamma-HCH transport system substrate-binding protein